MDPPADPDRFALAAVQQYLHEHGYERGGLRCLCCTPGLLGVHMCWGCPQQTLRQGCTGGLGSMAMQLDRRLCYKERRSCCTLLIPIQQPWRRWSRRRACG